MKTINKGYEEFKIFVRNQLSRYLTIDKEEGTERGEYYYFFSLIEKKYALEISDGFSLYEIHYDFSEMERELETFEIVWSPLENDFSGLKKFLLNNL